MSQSPVSVFQDERQNKKEETLGDDLFRYEDKACQATNTKPIWVTLFQVESTTVYSTM